MSKVAMPSLKPFIKKLSHSAVVICVCGSLSGLIAINAWGNPVQRDHIEVELVSEYGSVQPNTPQELGLRFLPDEHWHTYWINPGDSGIALSLEWVLPEGAEVSEIHWPYPQRIEVGHLVNYGYEGEHLLPITFSPPPNANIGDELKISVDAYWLVCRVECIPGEATLSLTLPVTHQPSTADVDHSALFDWARQRLPQPQLIEGQFDTSSGQLAVQLERSGVLQDWTPLPKDLFITTPNLVDHAKDVFVGGNDSVVQLSQPLSPYFTQSPASLQMVAVDQEKKRAYVFNLNAGSLISQGEWTGEHSYGWVLLFALLGGVILNLMPCVFPVLSIKALSVVQTSPAHQKTHAFAYTLGVVASFIVLAAFLLLLRAGGEAVGWGFQLQSPLLVGVLIYVFFVMGLSLSGYLDLTNRWMGLGDELTGHDGLKGSFMTGVLASVVASPCTAPFMGVALGAAVLMPWPMAIGVFSMLGLGLASPMLALGFSPAVARCLPKPGAWMETFKQLMAFPIYLAVVWLIWVLGRQTSPSAVAYILTGLVAITFGLWLHKQPERHPNLNGIRHSLLAFCLIAATAMLASASRVEDESALQNETWVAYSETALASAIADPEKAVFINMTADWCVTCLVNEQVALSSDEFKDALETHQVIYMKGDWTRRDPTITAYLSQFGRNGVPLYVAYPRDGSEPVVLPQVLTPKTVIDVLETL